MHLLILALFMILFFVTFSRKQSLDWPNEQRYLLAIVDPISGQNVGLKVGDHGLEKKGFWNCKGNSDHGLGCHKHFVLLLYKVKRKLRANIYQPFNTYREFVTFSVCLLYKIITWRCSASHACFYKQTIILWIYVTFKNCCYYLQGYSQCSFPTCAFMTLLLLPLDEFADASPPRLQVELIIWCNFSSKHLRSVNFYHSNSSWYHYSTNW